MTSKPDRDEEATNSHPSIMGVGNLEVDSRDSGNKSAISRQHPGEERSNCCKLVPMEKVIDEPGTRQTSSSSVEEIAENGCVLTCSHKGDSNQLFQEILAAQLGKIERNLSDDFQKTLQLVAGHLKTVTRHDSCMDALRAENQRLCSLLAMQNGVSSGHSTIRGETLLPSDNMVARPSGPNSNASVDKQVRRNTSSMDKHVDKNIPGMANVETSSNNGEATWRSVNSEPMGNGRGSLNSRFSRGALKSPHSRRSSNSGSPGSGPSGVTFQSRRRGSRSSDISRNSSTSRSSRQQKTELKEFGKDVGTLKDDIEPVNEEESDSDLSSSSTESSTLGSDSKEKDIRVGKQLSRLSRSSRTSRCSRASNKSPDIQFEVLPVWEKENVSIAATLSESKTTVGRYMRRKSLRRMSTNLFDGDNVVEMCLELRGASRFAHLVVHPNSIIRASWDAVSFCLIVYDIIAIPFQLFEPPDHMLLLIMAWITRFFWTIDLFASLNTGYALKSGNVEMRHSVIIIRYLRTWFALDILLVGVDWLELLWSGSSSLGFARIGKATRAFRILRMLRVLRMRQAFTQMIQRVRSEQLIVMADIAKIMLVIIGFAHIAACFWYGIGVKDDIAVRSWVNAGAFTEESLSYRYMTSLHWSLSQFSGGMDEVKPYNLEERTYCVFIFIVAFMMAAILTSSLTSSMTRLHMLSTRQSQQLSVLRRFLSDNGVSRVLSARVQRHANHAMMEQQRYQQESNVELLKVISEPLKMELHFEMYSPVLTKHFFFNTYASECPHVMRKVCHRSTYMALVSSRDIIFNAGELPLKPRMCWVCSGTLSYFSMVGQEFMVKEGDWISEGVLWTHWMHRGSLRANGDCRLCELDARSFQDIVGQFDHGDFDPKDYAAQFVRNLNQHQGEVTDLHLPPCQEEEEEEARPRRNSFQKVLETVNETVSAGVDNITDVGSTLVRRISGERRKSGSSERRMSGSGSPPEPVSPHSPKSPRSPPLGIKSDTIAAIAKADYVAVRSDTTEGYQRQLSDKDSLVAVMPVESEKSREKKEDASTLSIGSPSEPPTPL